MADPVEILDQRFEAAIRAALGDAAPEQVQTLVKPSSNPDFGDFQSNAAMPLAKASTQNPRELAQAIIDNLDIADIAEPPEIAGPGFINIRLKAEALGAALGAMHTPELGIEAPAENEARTVVVDLCGVNLAKQMHVGHLRATVIGDALARLSERLGHRVIRQNHFGDWGLPIAMVVHEVKLGLADGTIERDQLSVLELERIYRLAQQRYALGRAAWDAIQRYRLGPKAEAEWQIDFETGERYRTEARGTLVKLQSGDEETLELWELVARVTLDDCFANCRTLQANVTDEHTAGESTYRDELAEVVADLESRGVAEESDGALIVKLDEAGINEPCLIRKRDGGFLYATTDLAAIRRRVQQFHADRVIYAVDARQSLHFRQVFAAAHKAGYTAHDHRTAELFHAAFGTVLGPDNRPLKTRSGENVKLSDLLDEAISRARAAVAEKNPDLPEDEASSVAHDVGIGAIKYADLSSDRIKDYVFDFDRMLAFEGNTGPYLQYAHVRVRSILRKAGDELGLDPVAFEPGGPTNAGEAAFSLAAAEEKALALALLKYPSVVRGAAEACEPHRLCTYLFELAQTFSGFFQACPVLRAEDDATRDGRLRLTALAGAVLADGLSTLGIAAPERM